MTKKPNVVLRAYKEALEDPYEFHDTIEYIAKLVKEDQTEFENLVNLFNDLPENTISEIDTKLEFADILCNMNYQPAQHFLMRVIEHPIEEPPGLEYSYDWTNRDNKIWAAGNLIKLKDVRGKEFLENFLQQASQNEKDWIIEVLQEAANEMAYKLIRTFMDKDKYINDWLNEAGFSPEKTIEELKQQD